MVPPGKGEQLFEEVTGIDTHSLHVLIRIQGETLEKTAVGDTNE